MIKAIHKIIFTIINIIYGKVFHEEVSYEVEKFIENLSQVSIGTLIASIFGFSFNILAGRWLGPSEYGTFTLVQSVAMFLYIPMLLGFHTAMLKYNAEKIDFLRQRNIISTTYRLVFLFTIVSLLIYIIFSKELMAIFSISMEIFYLALFFAVLFVFYTLTITTLRSLHKIKAYSQLMLVNSVILFLAFIVSVFIFKDISYKSPLFSMLLAYGMIGGFILALIRKYLSPEFSMEWAQKLSSYSIYSLMGGISSILYCNIDKIFINIYLSISDLGIYWAYNYCFTTVILLCINIFVIVFFPAASMCTDKKMLFERIKKISIIVIICGWPITIISGYIFLKLYGGDYPFDLSLMLLFATAGLCITIDKLFGQLLSSGGIEGIKVTSFAAIILAIINVLLNILLIPQLGLNGAVIATIIGYLSSISIMLLYRKKLGI